MSDTPERNRKPTAAELAAGFTPPGTDASRLWESLKNAQCPPPVAAPDVSAFPDDPFGAVDSAGIATGEIYRSLLAGGIPLASVERIIGHMLANLPNPGDQSPGGV